MVFNKNISRDELEAYYFTHPELDYRASFLKYDKSRDELINERLVCFQNGKYVYVYLYQSGNIAKKLEALEMDKAAIIKLHGQYQYDIQKSLLEDVLPLKATFTGADKISLCPESNFAKNNTIRELRYDDVKLNGDTSLAEAYSTWCKTKISKGYFDYFIENELTVVDQERLSDEWNKKYNSIVNVKWDKIPVTATVELNDTQRDAVAFVSENKGGILSLGEEDKTSAALGSISESIINKPDGNVLIVTEDEDKWIKAINHKMPSGTSIVPLKDLNSSYVRNILKEYSTVEEMGFTMLEDEILSLKETENNDDALAGLKNKYNDLVYTSGKLKERPIETIYLISKEGAEKLNRMGLNFRFVCLDNTDNIFIDSEIKLHLVDHIDVEEGLVNIMQKSSSKLLSELGYTDEKDFKETFLLNDDNFNGFVNVPQLKRILKSLIIKKHSDTDVPGVPKKIIIPSDGKENTVPLTEEQDNLIQAVKDDNQVISFTKRGELLIALDMMERVSVSPYSQYGLADIDAEEFITSSPKLEYVIGCIKSVIEFQKEHNQKVSGQIIYLSYFESFYPLLKKYIIKKLELEPYQVGIISNVTSESEKDLLSRDYERGRLLVLIGNDALLRCEGLEKNTSTIYNVFYEKAFDEAISLEDLICKQGNRYANVRIIYPQTNSAADKITSGYLHRDRIAGDELWNDSTVQKINFDYYSFDELKAELLSDNPEELAKFKVKKEKAELEEKISFYESKRSLLEKAATSFKDLQELRPQAIQYLHELDVQKNDIYKGKAAKEQTSRLEKIVDNFVEELQRNIELEKFRKDKYDYDTDPDKKYVAKNYNDASDDVLLEDAKYWLKELATANQKDSQSIIDSSWGDYYYNRDKIFTILSKFEDALIETRRVQETILSPLGLSFKTSENPLEEFSEKILDLKSNLVALETFASVDNTDLEIKDNTKSVEERVQEFANDNELYLSSLLIEEIVDEVKPSTEEEIHFEPAEKNLEAII